VFFCKRDTGSLRFVIRRNYSLQNYHKQIASIDIARIFELDHFISLIPHGPIQPGIETASNDINSKVRVYHPNLILTELNLYDEACTYDSYLIFH